MSGICEVVDLVDESVESRRLIVVYKKKNEALGVLVEAIRAHNCRS